jgi:hypothetical protein
VLCGTDDDNDDVDDDDDDDQFPSIFFTAAGACYCSEQKIFTRPVDCATLLKVSCNMHNKNIYNKNCNNSVCTGAFQTLRGRAA